MKYAYITESAMKISVRRKCELLGVHPSGYYKQLNKQPCARERRHAALVPKIRRAFADSRETYGCRRVHKELVRKGVFCNRKTVAALMRKNSISPKRKRKYKCTTDSKHKFRCSPNLLNRDFSGGKPNLVWMSDITYIETKQGWLYLAVFIDRYSRRVVGWKAGSEMTANLVLEAFQEAQISTGKTPLLVHSDRGVQYASATFREKLRQTRCIQSMSRKGNCWDNAVAESFFGALKSEMIYRSTFETRDQAKLAIFDYIETFYNTSRLHSALGYLTPTEFTLKGKTVVQSAFS